MNPTRRLPRSSLGATRKEELPAHFMPVLVRLVKNHSNVFDRKVLANTSIIKDLLDVLP
jgi:hypothetical protein